MNIRIELDFFPAPLIIISQNNDGTYWIGTVSGIEVRKLAGKENLPREKLAEALVDAFNNTHLKDKKELLAKIKSSLMDRLAHENIKFKEKLENTQRLWEETQNKVLEYLELFEEK